MAFSPCDCHGRLFRGKSSYVYPAIITNGLRSGERRRLCPDGVADISLVISRHFESGLSGPQSLAQKEAACGWCGDTEQSRMGGVAYLTTYLGGGEREDWSAVFCDDCACQAFAGIGVTLPTTA